MVLDNGGITFLYGMSYSFFCMLWWCCKTFISEVHLSLSLSIFCQLDLTLSAGGINSWRKLGVKVCVQYAASSQAHLPASVLMAPLNSSQLHSGLPADRRQPSTTLLNNCVLNEWDHIPSWPWGVMDNKERGVSVWECVSTLHSFHKY